MRTNDTFRRPADFVPLSDEDGILAIGGAMWFATLLREIPDLEIDADPLQEDWGVVFYAQRHRKKFWIGLSAWDFEDIWLAHFHHDSLAWLQRRTSSGKSALARLLTDVHEQLLSDAEISEIAWYEERELDKPQPAGFSVPVDG
jgi:hypothetical protein